MKKIVILFGFFLTVSCCKEEIPSIEKDGNGIIVGLQSIWKKSLHAKEVSYNSYMRAPIIYKGNVAISTTNGEGNCLLTLIDHNNGATIWHWSDIYQAPTERIDISYYHQYNNLLTYQCGGRSYCINLDNGTTHWKIRRDKSYDGRVNPNTANTYFLKGEITNYDGLIEYPAYIFDINNGEYLEFLRGKYSKDFIAPDNFIGAITNIIKLPDSNNLYAITYAEPLPNWEVNSFLGLYNSDTKLWEYERKLMATPTQNTSVYWPQIYNNRLYASVGPNLVCHSLQTGEQIWIKQFTQDFLFSGFIIADDKIIANNEDTYTYCLSTYNGHTIWKEASAGTSGRMSYLNGIVYFVGGSTGKLHAIDISTGKTVWKLDGQKLDGADFKTNAVYVFEADGNNPAKVIALTHLNAYSFKAYK